MSDAVTVVIGAHARTLTHLLAHSPASVIVNRHWQEGLGASIRFKPLWLEDLIALARTLVS